METPQNTKEQAIDAKFVELKDIFKEKRNKLGILQSHEKVVTFQHALADKNGGMDNMRKYKLFHLLSGSTPVDEYSPEFDLPGGDMERFIREEL